MVEIGKFNKLKAVRQMEFGMFLDGAEDGEILLPRRYVKDDLKVGDEVEVFIHFDSEDRLTATLDKPKAQVGEFASLLVKSVEKVGAFLDWGLGKDLFLPLVKSLAISVWDSPWWCTCILINRIVSLRRCAWSATFRKSLRLIQAAKK